MNRQETPEPMAKLVMITPESKLKPVIRALHALGALHIEEHKKSETMDIGSPMKESEQISSLLVRIRSLQSSLALSLKPGRDLGGDFGREQKADLHRNLGRSDKIQSAKQSSSQQPGKDAFSASRIREMESFYGKLDKQLSILQAESDTLKQAVSQLSLELKNLKEIDALGIDIPFFSGFSSLSSFVGTVKAAEGLPEKLADAISQVTADFSLRIANHEQPLVAVFVRKDAERGVAGILAEFDFKPMAVPVLGKGETLKQAIKDKARELDLAQKGVKETLLEISQIAHRQSKRMLQDEAVLSAEIERQEAPLRFGRTDFAYVVTGWIPEKDCKSSMKEIRKAAAGKIFIEASEPGHHDKVPVKLHNSPGTRPFEFFLNLYSLPSYGEKDPTKIISILFPILFGFMLGDVGYGIVTLALSYYLKKKFGDQQLFGIIKYASISSIFFGILFGEYFGFEEFGHFEFWHILSRAHDLTELGIIAIAIGFVHLNIGLGLGFSNVLRHHGLKMAIFEKGSWWVLQAGAALIGLYLAKLLPTISLYAGISLILAFAVMIVKGEGIKGLVEMPAIFSNMLSYARLMAIGVSSVELAIVINEQSLEMFHKGAAGVIGGILVLLVGHSINLGLGLLGSFLHSLRLHYVEFFSKFFTGGGMRYQPFGKKEGSD
ncbi:V-type ATP synthase subunit I [Candidatus Woesearchaeota archaeon]|nr:V-type ATP synthase subunit I [Candidatus Woesearchaeota archaeon]